MSGQRPRGGIFISYRRSDSDGAGRLSDRLVARFGEGKVFMDVDSIEAGQDFREVIAEAVGSCDALLAIIGPNWLSATGSNGGRRLDDPNDLVRLEIEAALARNVRVIPVLIEQTAMPRESELPGSIARLATRNATQLRHTSFKTDIARLSDVLDKVLLEAAERRAAAATAPSLSDPDSTVFDADASSAGIRADVYAPDLAQRGRSKLVVVLAGIVVVIALVTLGAVRLFSQPADESQDSVSDISGTGSISIPAVASMPTSAGDVPQQPTTTIEPGAPPAPAASDPNTPETAATDPPTSAAAPTATIESPAEIDRVPSLVPVTGTAVLPADFALWIVIRPPDGSIHLTTRAPVAVDDAGKWATTAGVGRGAQDAGRPYVLYAVLAPRLDSEFSRFVQDGKTGGFADLPADVVPLDSVQVTLG